MIKYKAGAPREQGSCKATTAVAEQVLSTITGGKWLSTLVIDNVTERPAPRTRAPRCTCAAR